MTEESQVIAAPEPTNAPGRAEMPVEGRAGADTVSGSNGFISWGSRSDVGLVRGHNEDSFLLRAPLFAVCDGMGGHAAGEVASSLAVDTIGRNAPGTADDTLLGAAIEAANLTVINGAENGIGKPGMGCTASAVLIEGNKMAVGHVGDSRVYLLRRGTLVRVTHDHSYVEELVDSGQITADEARVHPSRSIITRALGSDPEMYADHFSLEVANGDRIIVCSDGLSSMISDADIESVAVSAASAQQAADNLVASALTAGGSDNVTVIVVDVKGFAEKRRRKVARKTKITIAFVLILLAAIVGGAAYGLNYWVSTAAYLGVDQGKVAIYRGVPGEFAGMSFSTLEKTTDIDVDDLQPGLANRLAENSITCDNVEAAESLVAEYEQEVLNKKQTEDERDRTRDEAQSDDSKASGQSASATASAASSEETQNDDASPRTSGSGDAA